MIIHRINPKNISAFHEDSEKELERESWKELFIIEIHLMFVHDFNEAFFTSALKKILYRYLKQDINIARPSKYVCFRPLAFLIDHSFAAYRQWMILARFFYRLGYLEGKEGEKIPFFWFTRLKIRKRV